MGERGYTPVEQYMDDSVATVRCCSRRMMMMMMMFLLLVMKGRLFGGRKRGEKIIRREVLAAEDKGRRTMS